MEKKMWSRREFLALAFSSAAGALVTACQPKIVKETVEVPVEVEKVVEKMVTPEPVTISWWNQFSGDEDVWGKIIQGFQDIYPHVTVDYEISGGAPGGGEFLEALLTRIVSGNPPDTTTLWSPPVQFAVRGSLMAIDEYMATAKWAKPGSFFEGPMGSCQWRGETYGLAASAGNTAILINKELFAEKGISTAREDFPKTWDELKRLSAEFVEWDGDELLMAGYVPWALGWTRVLWSGLNGGRLFDPVTEKYVIASDQNVEWMDFMLQWLDEQYKGDIELLNTFGKFGGAAPNGAFGLKREAMDDGGTWRVTAPYEFDWEVVPYPVGPSGDKSMTAWWPNWWAIPAGAPHPEEGFKLAEWFCTKGWEIWNREANLDTPAWMDTSRDIVPLSVIDKYGLERAQDLANFFLDYLNTAVPMWNSPIEDFASNTLGQAIDEILHKAKQPREALQEAQDLCQAKLEEVIAEG